MHSPSSLRWLLFWAALAAALAFRLVSLDVRPLHHDEGVAAAFELAVAQGRPYAYDPGGYHGPFLYCFGAGLLWLLGTGDAALRLPVALASALMIPLLLPLRRRLGAVGVTTAAWLLAVSPFFVYYGRDLIPETWLAVLTLALVVAGSRYLESRLKGDLLLAATCLGLLFTVKETAVLTVAGLLIAAAGARIWTSGRLRLNELRIDRKTAGLVVLAAAIPYGLLFTSFLTHPWGLIDSVWGLLLWVGKGAEGTGVHAKPWFYFLQWLLRYEPALLLGGLLGGGLALRRRDPWGSFCAIWLLSQLVIYSAIPYKTPWLALNILLPAALAAGFLVREIWDRGSRAARAGLLAILLLGLGWSGWRAFDVTFRRYDDPRLELPYAQTQREARGIVTLIRDVARRAPAGRGLTLNALLPYRWPLPWYLRDFPKARYWKRFQDIPSDFDADILLVDTREEDKLRPRLKGTYRRCVFPLLPVEQVAVYINERVESGQAPRSPAYPPRSRPSATSSTRLALPFQTLRTTVVPSISTQAPEPVKGCSRRLRWVFQVPISKSKSCWPSRSAEAVAARPRIRRMGKRALSAFIGRQSLAGEGSRAIATLGSAGMTTSALPLHNLIGIVAP